MLKLKIWKNLNNSPIISARARAKLTVFAEGQLGIGSSLGYSDSLTYGDSFDIVTREEKTSKLNIFCLLTSVTGFFIVDKLFKVVMILFFSQKK